MDKVFKRIQENERKESMRTWRRRKETLGVFQLYAKKRKTEHF